MPPSLTIPLAIVAASAILPVAARVAEPLAMLLIARLPESQRRQASQVVQVCVAAIEQTGSGLSGDQKKSACEQLCQRVLASLGIAVPAPLLDALIEAAVLALGAAQQAASSSAAPAASLAPTPAQIAAAVAAARNVSMRPGPGAK